MILKYLPELSPTERLQPTAVEPGTVLGVGTFGLDASMPTGTASAALLLLLAVCVRARAWVCTTPFALASLELNRDCAVVPVCVFRRSAAGMRTSLSVCLFAGRACDYLGRSCRQNHRCKCHGNPLLWHSGLARPPGTCRVRVPTVGTHNTVAGDFVGALRLAADRCGSIARCL